MPIETITFQGEQYPAFQAEGNAAQWIRPFTQRLCKGKGYDIGFGRPEWCLPGAIPIELNRYGIKGCGAMNLPEFGVDFIVASHVLEHLGDWVAAIEYWTSALKNGGILFIYTAHSSQRYWRPYNNRKHKHWFEPNMIVDCMRAFGYINIFNSERDLNHSFSVVGEKG